MIFVNIPQLKNEKDWLVWKFQVHCMNTDALKTADQWQFVTGTANADADNYESKKQKAFYFFILLKSIVHRAEGYISANGHEL